MNENNLETNKKQEGNKKNKNIVTIILFSIVGLLMITSLTLSVSKMVESLTDGIREAKDRGVFDWSEIQDALAYGDEIVEDTELPSGDAIDEITPDTEGKSYVPSPDDEYYVEFADALDDSLSYSIEMKDYSYISEEQQVRIIINYPQITGGVVRNEEILNREIEENALFYMKNYASKPERGKVNNCFIRIDSYITYMDEGILSIIMDETCYMSDAVNYADVFSININIETGQIMDNASMIHYSKELAKDFRKQSDYQNGHLDVLDRLSDEEIADYLQDEDSGIIFYTPVGLEIGINYVFDNQPGWVTATIKNYEKYVNRL